MTEPTYENPLVYRGINIYRDYDTSLFSRGHFHYAVVDPNYDGPDGYDGETGRPYGGAFCTAASSIEEAKEMIDDHRSELISPETYLVHDGVAFAMHRDELLCSPLDADGNIDWRDVHAVDTYRADGPIDAITDALVGVQDAAADDSPLEDLPSVSDEQPSLTRR